MSTDSVGPDLLARLGAADVHFTEDPAAPSNGPAADSFTISLLRGRFDGLRSAVVRGPVVAVPTVTVAAGPIPFVIKLVAGDGWQHVAENVVELPARDRRSGRIALAGGWGVVIRTDPRRLVTWYR